MAASTLCATTCSPANLKNNSVLCKNNSVLCNSANKYYTVIKSDVQAPVSEDKSMTVASDILRKEGPRGEEITIQASRKIPCDKKGTICECYKNMVTELSEVKLELSSSRKS